MRLREMASVVRDILPELKMKLASEGSNGNFRFYNYQSIVKSIRQISEIGIIDEELNKLKEMDFIYSYKTDEEYIIINSSVKGKIENIIFEINKKCQTLLDIERHSLKIESEESIDVKLPEFKDLKEVSRFFNDLNNALEIVVVNKSIKGKVELQNFESGSLWISIYVGTQAAVLIIGKIVSMALKSKKQYLENKMIEEKIRAMSNLGDLQETLVKSFVENLENENKQRAEELLDNSEIEKNPEYQTKFIHSVGILTKLIYEGAEIHPTLTAANEVKEEFPNFKKFASTVGMKTLQEKISDSEDDGEE